MLWHCGQYVFDSSRPTIMGIVNVTPDSFSDGGDYFSQEAAIEQGKKLAGEGASIIDVGGESTRPGSDPVSEDEEWRRVGPVIKALSNEGICVSVDTRHSGVAKKAVEAGASIINDVSGFRDEGMVEAAVSTDAGGVCMHMKGEPKTMQADTSYSDVVDEVRDYLWQQAEMLESAGVEHDRICIDPGPGFGKDARQSLDVMRNIHELVHLGYPVMCAVSRKSYIGQKYHIDNPKDRDEASATEALMACELGASVVRTHNVTATLKALKDLRPSVLIGMGSNIGLGGADDDQAKVSAINQAIAHMCMLPDTLIIDIAPMYRSEPAYVEDQPDFINTVVLLRSGLPPKELLAYLQAIENSMGRKRVIDKGPRIIDLDIIDYQMYLADSETLTLPHPFAVERDFVVRPVSDILPGYVLADGMPIDRFPASERIGRACRI
ncbi:MAG: dihydropteroate synthase [Eggerthellaceae bacterium]|nr:dihydropteroate synthase [Eggerthellaceae bacterium]